MESHDILAKARHDNISQQSGVGIWHEGEEAVYGVCVGDGEKLTVVHQYGMGHQEHLCKFGFPELHARISSTVLRKYLENPLYIHAVSFVFIIITKKKKTKKTLMNQENLETWKV